MFWGLQLEPTLRYSQQVPKSFRITKATLDGGIESGTTKSISTGQGIVQVFIEKDGNEYPIATLRPGHVYDCPLDLRFTDGEDICFFVKGDGIVYLTGHELFDEGDDDEQFYPLGESDDSDDVEANYSDEDSSDNEADVEDITDKPDLYNKETASGGSIAPNFVRENGASKVTVNEDDVEDDDDEDDDEFEEELDEDSSDDNDGEEDNDLDEDDVDDEEEEEEEIVVKPGQKRPAGLVNGATPESKKAKTLAKETPSGKNNGQATPNKLEKQPKTPKTDKTPKAEKTPKHEKTPKSNKTPKPDKDQSQDDKVKTPGNSEHISSKEVKVEDIRPGSGPIAKRGKMVYVYYTGTLMNGKKFDSCTSGKPFSFKLGTGSVIQGWDQGIEGMKVGGKRRLVIPPRLAYGKQGTGPIPPNATLRFDVELKAVN
ncbi:FK506-binding protein 4-like [Varroa jacobsoni]|uniref:FK506-binding protein n=1 Tax=Varroa destructor TaxID=109461 RepID=A0A7M7JNU2_VARDE|nr:FK506-binding protein 4-like [Varroa destructor]XP_022695284.1 FK506-binding protein 4-like [Varroa jacobsoni]